MQEYRHKHISDKSMSQLDSFLASESSDYLLQLNPSLCELASQHSVDEGNHTGTSFDEMQKFLEASVARPTKSMSFVCIRNKHEETSCNTGTSSVEDWKRTISNIPDKKAQDLRQLSFLPNRSGDVQIEGIYPVNLPESRIVTIPQDPQMPHEKLTSSENFSHVELNMDMMFSQNHSLDFTTARPTKSRQSNDHDQASRPFVDTIQSISDGTYLRNVGSILIPLKIQTEMLLPRVGDYHNSLNENVNGIVPFNINANVPLSKASFQSPRNNKMSKFKLNPVYDDKDTWTEKILNYKQGSSVYSNVAMNISTMCPAMSSANDTLDDFLAQYESLNRESISTRAEFLHLFAKTKAMAGDLPSNSLKRPFDHFEEVATTRTEPNGVLLQNNDEYSRSNFCELEDEFGQRRGGLSEKKARKERKRRRKEKKRERKKSKKSRKEKLEAKQSNASNKMTPQERNEHSSDQPTDQSLSQPHESAIQCIKVDKLHVGRTPMVTTRKISTITEEISYKNPAQSGENTLHVSRRITNEVQHSTSVRGETKTDLRNERFEESSSFPFQTPKNDEMRYRDTESERFVDATKSHAHYDGQHLKYDCESNMKEDLGRSTTADHNFTNQNNGHFWNEGRIPEDPMQKKSRVDSNGYERVDREYENIRKSSDLYSDRRMQDHSYIQRDGTFDRNNVHNNCAWMGSNVPNGHTEGTHDARHLDSFAEHDDSRNWSRVGTEYPFHQWEDNWHNEHDLQMIRVPEKNSGIDSNRFNQDGSFREYENIQNSSGLYNDGQIGENPCIQHENHWNNENIVHMNMMESQDHCAQKFASNQVPGPQMRTKTGNQQADSYVNEPREASTQNVYPHHSADIPDPNQSGRANDSTRLLCSESFLDRCGDIVAELCTGGWNQKMTTPTEHVQRQSDNSQKIHANFDVCDCGIVDLCGVDIELPGGIGLVVITNLQNVDVNLIAATKRLVNLASTSRYKIIHVLLRTSSADYNIESIARLQNSVVKQKGCTCQQMRFHHVHQNNTSNTIARLAMSISNNDQLLEVENIDMDKAAFLVWLNPFLTAHEILLRLKQGVSSFREVILETLK